MKCPTCGCEKFYIKDEDDEYEIYEFTTFEKKIVFDENFGQQKTPKISGETQTFCNQCAWHGKFVTLTR